MSTETPCFINPPIVEAVLDIDCDMAPTFSVESNADKACELYKDPYQKMRKRYVHQHEIKQKVGGDAEISTPKVEIQALQLIQEDEKQLIQVRSQGYSFNRLAPYTSLDDYLEEVQRTWELFVKEFAPIQVQRVRLRFINRILLPLEEGKLDLDAYLRVGPRLTDDDRLDFTDFLNQHHVVEKRTENMAKIILASQATEGDKLPIIFDIEAVKQAPMALDWDSILEKIGSLRDLKNHLFCNTLTEKCTDLFQQKI